VDESCFGYGVGGCVSFLSLHLRRGSEVKGGLTVQLDLLVRDAAVGGGRAAGVED
jgi:hypothetical protein